MKYSSSFRNKLLFLILTGLLILSISERCLAQKDKDNDDETEDSQAETEESNNNDNVGTFTEISTKTSSMPTQQTNKPISIKTTTTTKTIEIENIILPTDNEADAPTFTLKDDRGNICILLTMDATITLNKTTAGSHPEKSLYVDKDADTDGYCEDDSSVINIAWGAGAYVLTWKFAKTSGGEKWYVDKISMQFDASLIKDFFDEGKYEVSTPTDKSAMLFPTPVGRSYICRIQNKTTVPLDGTKFKAVLVMTFLRAQPFLSKGYYGPEYVCPSHFFRDETAPIAVGSTMAIMVLLTVTGYGIYRYFKVKKVQYDTME